MSTERNEPFERARRALVSTYFLLGLVFMSWVPRFPQVKDGLDLSAARFGLLLSVGAIGAILGNIAIGHAAYRFGSKRVIFAAVITTYSLVGLITFSPNALIFGLAVAILSASYSAINVGLNAQSVFVQQVLGRPIIGTFHGWWGVGAVVAGSIAGVVAPYATPQLHVGLVATTFLPLALWLTRSLVPPENENLSSDNTESVAVPNLLRAPRLTWLLAIGAAGGSMIEFVNVDWSTIYAHEVLGIRVGRDVLLFMSLTLAITIGRLSVDKVTARFGAPRLVRIGGLMVFGGTLFGAFGSNAIAETSPTAALTVGCVGFAIAGFGTAPMMPAFYGAAGRVDGSPLGITLSRMGMAHQIIVWVFKALISFLVGLSSIHMAFVLPAIMALVAVALARHTDVRSQPVGGGPLPERVS
jgi:hypothetical protein